MNITSEELRKIIQEEIAAVLAEEGEKDACYHKVKARYDVWPSAYASGALVKCRKVGAENWGKSKKNEDKVPGGFGDNLTGTMEEKHQQLASLHGVPVKEIDAQVEKGMKVEMEHTSDEEIAHEIAMEHVYEDPKYYDKLEKIEEKIKKVDGKFVVYPSRGGDRLGTHDTLKAARKQLAAIEISKKKNENLNIDEAKKKAGTESSKETSLRDWFGRKGEKGSKGGWVDCNSPDGSGGYKACGREEGEDRKRFPACRPTPAACKEQGRGKTWGKKGKKK